MSHPGSYCGSREEDEKGRLFSCCLLVFVVGIGIDPAGVGLPKRASKVSRLWTFTVGGWQVAQSARRLQLRYCGVMVMMVMVMVMVMIMVPGNNSTGRIHLVISKLHLAPQLKLLFPIFQALAAIDEYDA